MMKKALSTACILLYFFLVAHTQNLSTQVENIQVSSSTAKFLGKSKPIRVLTQKLPTSKEKKEASRRLKKVPQNFKGRRTGGNSINENLAHQGPDRIRQKQFPGNGAKMLKRPATIANVDGLNAGGSPHDPTGDVSDEYYVQAINVTTVGVFDLRGNLIQSFAMNTLWTEFNSASAGDPIVLYDESAEKWFVTEFTDPANMLVAVSETKDPLGSYTAYSFSTPQFPDYPKFAITPEALVVTTNEEGPGTLHQYFLDIQALHAGLNDVTMIRVDVPGNTDTEAGFYVSTPVDWNGSNLPFDNRPITLRLNDSSWPGGPMQDQIELYTFNLDFDTPTNTTVDQISIPTAPYDAFPCAIEDGFSFACIPQFGGDGLDGIPEVIMNIPHLRNFGTHESLVFNFVTDLTDGENVAGIRWIELRRTADTDWELYQEGTFGPDDGLNRFMGSIAMDDQGNIGLAYTVSSDKIFAGLRYTGRLASDSLGIMTLGENILVDGGSTINSFGRFGDYAQLSVTPDEDNVFWFTGEYATANDAGTRIAAFRLFKDSIDLAAQAIISPATSDLLGANELVTAEFVNEGIEPIANYTIGLMLDGALVTSTMIADTLQPDSMLSFQFASPIDLTAVRDYNISIFVDHPEDVRAKNDTARVEVSKLFSHNGGIVSEEIISGCENNVSTTLTLTNFGGQVIADAIIEVSINGMIVDTIETSPNIAFEESAEINYTGTDNLQLGINTIEFTISSINGEEDLGTTNNTTSFNYNLFASDQFITLVFTLDDYPEETSWSIIEEESELEIASGSFAPIQARQVIQQKICLDVNGCYKLIVSDAFGDGICCDFGNGNFQVLNNQGITIISNDGEFGAEAIEAFCPSKICVLTATVDVENASGADVADGSIMINASNGVGPFQYSIDGGTTTQSSPLFDNLLPGAYEVLVISADSICDYAETVELSFTTGIHEVNGQSVEVKIQPNPTSGVFEVTISNLSIKEALLDFEIYDINGKLIQRRTVGKFNKDYKGTFSLYDYPNGNYFLRLINKEVNILERIIKVN